MAEILTRLSEHVNAALPHLALMALARKCAAAVVYATASVTSGALSTRVPAFSSFELAYRDTKRRTDALWASLYLLVMLYAVFDLANNAGSFLNCGQSDSPRPIGVFCAIALTCFVFTTRLSASTAAVVVLLCAQERSTLTGLAATLCVALWADSAGAGVLLACHVLLAGAHAGVCRSRSSAALCVMSATWACTWVALAAATRLAQLAQARPKTD